MHVQYKRQDGDLHWHCSAYELDLQVEAKLREIEKSAILVNHRNTKTQRDRNNAARRESHRQQAVARSEARTELKDLNDAIQRSAAETRQLREKKKALQSSSGVKQTKRKGEKAKERLPDPDELAGLSEEAEPASFQAPQLHVADLQEFSNAEVQLDAALEPIFPAQYNDFTYLPGDLTNHSVY